MSIITTKDMGRAERTTATNGRAVVQVVQVLTKNEVRAQAGYVSQDDGEILNSTILKMTREQAVALRDALNTMDI